MHNNDIYTERKARQFGIFFDIYETLRFWSIWWRVHATMKSINGKIDTYCVWARASLFSSCHVAHRIFAMCEWSETSCTFETTFNTLSKLNNNKNISFKDHREYLLKSFTYKADRFVNCLIVIGRITHIWHIRIQWSI